MNEALWSVKSSRSSSENQAIICTYTLSLQLFTFLSLEDKHLYKILTGVLVCRESHIENTEKFKQWGSALVLY